jgi:hypothetical protein
MAPLSINCPRCLKQVVQVPLDGLVLYYECPEHGALILRPLEIVDPDEAQEVGVRRTRVSSTTQRSIRR